MNVKLLRRVRRHILAEPARLRMGIWKIRGTPGEVSGNPTYLKVRDGWGEPLAFKFPKCGTVGCIKGWAEMLAEGGEGLDISGDTERMSLFYVSSWPSDLRDAYLNAKSQRERARLVGKRIDRFIEEHKETGQ